jgi:hypothetical protein
MPGQYHTGDAVRPRLCGQVKEGNPTGRLYLCPRCGAQVVICPCCDRGNIYCNRGCGEESRRITQSAPPAGVTN